MELFTIGLVLVLLFLGWYYLIKPHRYWSDKGVPQTKPRLLLGDIEDLLFRQRSTGEWLQSIYNLAPDSRYMGCYYFNSPILIIKDPQLIKQLAIKDFNSFSDHSDFVDPDTDPLWGRNLFALKGDKWKDMRHAMSPTFSSGKLKYMYELMTEQAETFVKYFQSHNRGEILDVDMKDVTSRFANDVIASAAFGLSVNSLKHRDNEFYRVGKIMTNFSGFRKQIKLIALQHFPKVTNQLGLTFIEDYPRKYFTKVISDTIKLRKEKNIVRPDLIHILMEGKSSDYKSKSESQMKLGQDEITSQAIVFFFAGSDTISTVLSFAAYELALHKDIQDKLRDELRRNAVNGKVSYEILHEMPYLDMVVCETLRKWPVVTYIDRICNKQYTIQPVKHGERPLTVPQGTEIWFPAYPLHRDPNYYPDPDKFDPKRFSPENKCKIASNVYLPFGCGPRLCIGSRFAEIEIKALLFNLLLNFEIVTTPKTKPLVLSKGKEINPSIDGGQYWLGLKKILN